MTPRFTACAECVWCSLDVRLEEGSRFVCLKTRKTLPDNVVSRPPCERFEPYPPAAFWGP